MCYGDNLRGREILEAIEMLGGRAQLSSIYVVIRRMRREHGELIPRELEASVRNGLQRHNKYSAHYGQHDDWFRNPEPGVWELASLSSGLQRTHWDDNDHLIQLCEFCGKECSRGYGVFLGRDQLGFWYCKQHDPHIDDQADLF